MLLTFGGVAGVGMSSVAVLGGRIQGAGKLVI